VRLAEGHVHFFCLVHVHVVGFRLVRELLRLVDERLTLPSLLPALLVEPLYDFIFDAVVRVALAVVRLLEIVEGVLVNEIDLVQILSLQLVGVLVALGEGEGILFGTAVLGSEIARK